MSQEDNEDKVVNQEIHLSEGDEEIARIELLADNPELLLLMEEMSLSDLVVVADQIADDLSVQDAEDSSH
ncbi:MAG: hypothetical protein ACFBSC_16365 [Microcoleaceae cyanobacterium]